MSDVTSRCSMCKETLPASAFFKTAKAKSGCSNRCKACDAAYRKSRKEQRAAYMREYVKSEKYRERRNQARRDKTLVRMRHKIEAFSGLENPVLRRWRLNAAKRYTARLQATPAWLSAEHKQRTSAIYAATQQLQELTAIVYNVDHIVPLVGDTVCGLHVWWNLQPLPEYENAAKNNLFDPTIFPAQGEVAFPDGAGPLVARLATHLEKVEESDE